MIVSFLHFERKKVNPNTATAMRAVRVILIVFIILGFLIIGCLVFYFVNCISLALHSKSENLWKVRQ